MTPLFTYTLQSWKRKKNKKIEKKIKFIENRRERKRIRKYYMCVQILVGVRVHVFSDQYSQDKAYTFIVKMRSIEGYVRRYQLRCGLDGQVAKLRLSTWEFLWSWNWSDVACNTVEVIMAVVLKKRRVSPVFKPLSQIISDALLEGKRRINLGSWYTVGYQVLLYNSWLKLLPRKLKSRLSGPFKIKKS